MQQLFTRIDTALTRFSRYAPLSLRLGLATVFLYAAVSSFISPKDWIGYLPGVLTSLIPATTLLIVFSIVELVLVAWLLSGIYARYAGLACAAMLAGIVASNASLLPISFRDIGLIFSALALALIAPEE